MSRQKAAAPPSIAASSSRSLPLIELPRGCCRWAVDRDDDNRWLFCAGDTGDAMRPFCPDHSALAYQRSYTREERQIALELRTARRRAA